MDDLEFERSRGAASLIFVFGVIGAIHAQQPAVVPGQSSDSKLLRQPLLRLEADEAKIKELSEKLEARAGAPAVTPAPTAMSLTVGGLSQMKYGTWRNAVHRLPGDTALSIEDSIVQFGEGGKKLGEVAKSIRGLTEGAVKVNGERK